MIASPGSVRWKSLVDYLYEVIQDEDLTGSDPEKELCVLFNHFVADMAAVFADAERQPPVRGN